MKRQQKSGAEKRKIAAAKKAKEEAINAKIPKINTLLFSIASTSSTGTEKIDDVNQDSDCEIESTATSKSELLSDYEIDSPVIQEGSDFGDESELMSHSDSSEFSCDAGLWDISTNIASLQIYWIGKGECRMSNEN